MSNVIVNYLYLIFTLATAEKIKNYYLGVEIPGEGKNIASAPKVEFFKQKLNHFDPVDNTTWLQAYWENKNEYRTGGPVFLLINGEAPASPVWMKTGSWLMYGKELNAMYILVEHRFYGSSQPTKNTSTENLLYLSSQQALADLAYFIESMNTKHNLPKNTKWITFGGSYGGSLAVWLRLKYPHLVYGAVSSSGPLLAKSDFNEYFEVVHRSISSYSKNCANEIIRANKQLNAMVKTIRGRLFLTEWFDLCDELSAKEDDISFLFLTLAYNFANLVQYDKGYKNETGLNTIRGVCNAFAGPNVGNKTSSIRRYAEINKKLSNVSEDDCLTVAYDSYIKMLRKTDWENSNIYGRPWIYQTCTEFGFYQTSRTEQQLFGTRLSIKFYTQQCEDIFGPKFTENVIDNGVNRTNIAFGGLDINVDRIIYTHGSVDPWYPLGIYQSEENTHYKTIFIKGTSHCSDLNEPSNKDSIELKNARRTIKNTIQSWFNKNL